MGRLFWKIFSGIWLSLVLTGLGVMTAFVIHNRARFEEADRLARDPRSAFVSRMVALSLEHNGERVTRAMLSHWPVQESPPPFVVSARGHDLLGRAIPRELYAEAREQKQNPAPRPLIRQVVSPSGGHYMVFLPADASRPPRLRPEYPAALFGAALIASLIVSVLLARHFTRPIARLRDAFSAVAAGRLETRVAPAMHSRRDEIGALGRDFDAMAQQLEQLVATRNRLLHYVSHELRSPLARLQTAVGLAEQQPERSAFALERIRTEAERLDALVGEVLTLARLESAGPRPLEEEYVDLKELLASVVDDARFEAEGSTRRILLSDDLDHEVVLCARGSLLHRAFDNVVRNALQHSPENGVVEVSLTELASGRLSVSIRDEGPGVSADQLQSIFEPFFRAASHGAGYGLGLAIARRAIEAHGGTILACNRASGGLEVRIELPLPEATPAQARRGSV